MKNDKKYLHCANNRDFVCNGRAFKIIFTVRYMSAKF
jgi:hypothetical protein